MTDFPDKYDHRAAERILRARWRDETAFAWDPALPADLDYAIDTPPPTVSGTLHVGHVYSYAQADIIARYFRMSGRNVLYPVGWDDNGLPTERLVEKVRKVRGGTMPRQDFVALCREVIGDYEDRFRDLFDRLALSVDWSREYRTISDRSRAISQMSFLDLYEKGLLERRMEPVLWDPADRTAIAQAEVDEMERDGLLHRIAFALEGGGEAVIATTRPELIVSCVAIIVHPDHPRAGELVGRNAISPLFNVVVPIIADDKADLAKGTGIVQCCTFGDVADIAWWRTHKLPLRISIDRAGRMIPDLPIGDDDWPSTDPTAARDIVARFAGRKAAAVRAEIPKILKQRGLLRGQEKTRQVVPVAERSGAPLELIVTPQWFIRTLDFKDRLLAKGREIIWRPDHMRQRYESWVEGLKWDWAISRQRHFGVPLPVWYSKRAGEEGRILVPDADRLPVDPTVDLPKGYGAEEVERETDVMDTWATSSVTPQLVTRTITDTYGFDQAAHKRLFPMAMRPQAHEIIRTWAFYSIVKAMHHQDTVPWRSITISGWCLAGDGSKMSKSKGNIVDPIKLLDEYGTDPLRYWTGTSRLGNDTALAPNTLKQGKRLVTKLWNAARLAHMALAPAAIAPTTPRGDVEAGTISHPLDLWLLGELSATVRDATAAFDAYEYAAALRHIEGFFWRIHCDNYLELVKSRTRIDGTPSPAQRSAQRSALHTLYHATMVAIRLFAPVTPYVCETLNDLFARAGDRANTVHARGNWPSADAMVKPGLNGALGTRVLSVLGGVRKAKADRDLSPRAPVDVLWLQPQATGLDAAGLAAELAPVLDDIMAVTVSAAVRFDEAETGVPTAVSPDKDLAVHLKLAGAA